MDGNILLDVGQDYDTGLIKGGKVVRKKMVTYGALPDTTTKSVAHGIAGVDVTGYCKVEIIANDGTTSMCVIGTVDATNVNFTTAVDLQLFVGGIAYIHYQTT